MAGVEDRDQLRQRVLEALYDLTDGETNRHLIKPEELQEQAGIDDRAQLDAALDWLSDRDYAGYVTFGGIDIKPAGVDRVEEDRRTAGVTLDAVAIVPVEILRDIETFMRRLSLALERGEFDTSAEVKAQLEADLATSRHKPGRQSPSAR